MKRWLILLVVCFQVFLLNAAMAGTVPRPVAADLTVEAIATSSACIQGKPCAFFVIIRNQGSAPYRGAIAFSNDLPALTLLAEPLPRPWACIKKGRGQFNCRHPGVSIEPGQKLSIAVALKVIGSSFGKMEHCGLIEWGDATASRNQAVRQRLGQIGYPVRDGRSLAAATRDVKAKIGMAPNDQIDAAFAASLIGPWGEGDRFAGNDKGCVAFELFETGKKPLERCQAGKGLVNGDCISLANYCPGGQTLDPASASCKCPTGRPFWSPETGQCEAAQMSEACKPGQSMAKGECLCPTATPVWHIGQTRCMAIDVLQLAAVDSKADLSPSCSGGRVLDATKTDCICPRGLRDSPDGCLRAATVAPPQPPVVRRTQARRVPNCVGARVWSSSLGRCVRIAKRESKCNGGQIRRNGKCLWPKRGQASKPVLRRARLAARPERAVRRCDGLARWSKTMRHCIPLWIMLP